MIWLIDISNTPIRGTTSWRASLWRSSYTRWVRSTSKKLEIFVSGWKWRFWAEAVLHQPCEGETRPHRDQGWKWTRRLKGIKKWLCWNPNLIGQHSLHFCIFWASEALFCKCFWPRWSVPRVSSLSSTGGSRTKTGSLQRRRTPMTQPSWCSKVEEPRR